MTMNTEKFHATVLSKDPIVDNFIVSIDNTGIILKDEFTLLRVTKTCKDA